MNENVDEKIDFVVMWVDGSDIEWQKEKNKYLYGIDKLYNKDERYRDWDNMQYWFRGIEKFAPFVNKIHFVTMGHLPKWLNTNHPKLNIVKHKDFMPKEYLPTFNDNSIELNLHKIKGLAEHFVLFNDDIFLTNYVQKSDFFVNGKPVDNFNESPILSDNPFDMFSHILLNCVSIINNNFNKINCIEKYKELDEVGKRLLESLNLEFKENFLHFSIHHLAQNFRKSTFEQVWEKEEKVLDEICKNKFRTVYDVCQYIFKYWQIASGNVWVTKNKLGKGFPIQDDMIDEIVDSIKNQSYKQICINEPRKFVDFEKMKKIIQDAFESILPNKSSFEL